MNQKKIAKEEVKELKEEALRYICPHFASNAELAVAAQETVKNSKEPLSQKGKLSQ